MSDRVGMSQRRESRTTTIAGYENDLVDFCEVSDGKFAADGEVLDTAGASAACDLRPVARTMTRHCDVAALPVSTASAARALAARRDRPVTPDLTDGA